jgi:hypothetical protein
MLFLTSVFHIFLLDFKLSFFSLIFVFPYNLELKHTWADNHIRPMLGVVNHGKPIRRAWACQPCQTQAPGPGKHMETMKTPLHVTLFLLKSKGNFIWKQRKHIYMQPCFCWNPRIISYSDYFNNKKRRRSHSTHAYSPLKAWLYLHCFFFWKDKRNPNLKVKILCPEEQISIYTATQKT